MTKVLTIVFSLCSVVVFAGERVTLQQVQPQSTVVYQQAPVVYQQLACTPGSACAVRQQVLAPQSAVSDVQTSTEVYNVPVPVTTTVQRSAQVPGIEITGTVPQTQLQVTQPQNQVLGLAVGKNRSNRKGGLFARLRARMSQGRRGR